MATRCVVLVLFWRKNPVASKEINTHFSVSHCLALFFFSLDQHFLYIFLIIRPVWDMSRFVKNLLKVLLLFKIGTGHEHWIRVRGYGDLL